MKGYITTRQEFLFPDSPLGEMADKVHLAMAANGRMGIQLLVAAGESIRVSEPEEQETPGPADGWPGRFRVSGAAAPAGNAGGRNRNDSTAESENIPGKTDKNGIMSFFELTKEFSFGIIRVNVS